MVSYFGESEYYITGKMVVENDCYYQEERISLRDC